MCLVEVKGAKALMPSCVTTVSDGMEVQTNSPRARNARRTMVELILSDHDGDCQTCDRSADCELQAIASDLGIRNIPFSGMKSKRMTDASTPALVRDTAKCVSCRSCVTVCGETQGVGAIFPQGRGFKAMIGPAFPSRSPTWSACSAGSARRCAPWAQSASATRLAGVGGPGRPEEDGRRADCPRHPRRAGGVLRLSPGTLVTGKMVTALRQMGFDRVFDTNFTADLTIMEEGTELLTRLKEALVEKKQVALPMFTSCSPGWIRYAEHFWPDILPNISTCKSPQQMFGAVAKTYFAEKIGKRPRTSSWSPSCPARPRSTSRQRPEMYASGVRDVDVVLTTRELGRMIRQAGIDLPGCLTAPWTASWELPRERRISLPTRAASWKPRSARSTRS